MSKFRTQTACSRFDIFDETTGMHAPKTEKQPTDSSDVKWDVPLSVIWHLKERRAHDGALPCDLLPTRALEEHLFGTHWIRRED